MDESMRWVDGAPIEHQRAAMREAAPSLDPTALEQAVRIIGHFNSLEMRKRISPGEAAAWVLSLADDGVKTHIGPQDVLDSLCAIAKYAEDVELLEGEIGRSAAILFG